MKMNNWIKKWAKDLNTHLIKEGIQMASKYVKRCSTSYIIRELGIKTIRYYYILIRMTKIENTDKSNAGRDVQ